MLLSIESFTKKISYYFFVKTVYLSTTSVIIFHSYFLSNLNSIFIFLKKFILKKWNNWRRNNCVITFQTKLLIEVISWHNFQSLWIMWSIFWINSFYYPNTLPFNPCKKGNVSRICDAFWWICGIRKHNKFKKSLSI